MKTKRSLILLVLLFALLASVAIAACSLTTSGDDRPPGADQTITARETQRAGAFATLTAEPRNLVAFMGIPEGQVSPYGPVGCDSYLVPVEVGTYAPGTPPDQVIASALAGLLAIDEQFYTAGNLYNALALSTLAVDSVTIDTNGQTVIALSGEVMLAGVCADALLAAQIEFTAQHYGDVTGVSVTINGTPLPEILSGQ